jgi:hypothetical protein
MKTSARCAAAFLTSAIVAGCASMITPEKIDPGVYANYTCDQIRDEKLILTKALTYATRQQRTSVLLAATGGVGGAVASGWHGSQIANFKGRLIALKQISASKACS